MGDSTPFKSKWSQSSDGDGPDASAPNVLDDHKPKQAGLWQWIDGAGAAGDPRAVGAAGTAGTGEALPHGDAIQRSFGKHDVSGVTAHTGGAAADASRALGAHAYAQGDHVAFASSPDLHTAAHEAAHTVQQRNGASVPGGIDGGAGDAHERHADAVADRVVRGQSAEGLLDQTGGSGGGAASVQRSTAPVQRKSVVPSVAPPVSANVVDAAKQDAQLAAHESAAQLATRMQAHAESPMYFAELSMLLDPQEWSNALKSLDSNLQSRANTAKQQASYVTDATQIAAAQPVKPTQHTLFMLARSASSQSIPLFNEALVNYLFNHRYATLQQLFALHQGQVEQGLGMGLGLAAHDGLIPTGAIANLDKGSGSAMNSPIAGATAGSEATTQEASGLQDASQKLATAQANLQNLENELQLQLQELAPAIFDPNEHDQTKMAAQQQRVATYMADFRKSPRYLAAQHQVALWGGIVSNELTTQSSALLERAHDPDGKIANTSTRDLVIASYRDLAATEAGAQQTVIWAKQYDTATASSQQADNAGYSQAELTQIKAIGEIAQSTDAYYKLQHIAQILEGGGGAATAKTRLQAAIQYIQTYVCTPYKAVNTMRGLAAFEAKLATLQRNWSVITAPTEADALRVAKEFLSGAEAAAADTVLLRVWNGFGRLVGIFNGGAALDTVANPIALLNTLKGLHGNLLGLKDELAKLKHQPKPEGGAAPEAEPESEEAIENRAKELVDEIHGSYLTFEKAFGVLGLVGSAMAAEADYQFASEYPSVATWAKFGGDVASAVGSALMLTPLAPLGELISLAGAAVSLVAGWFIGDPVGNARRGDEKSRLIQERVFSPAVAATLTTPSSAGNLATAQTLGLSMAQIDALAASQPYLFTVADAMRSAGALWRYLKNSATVAHDHWQLSSSASASFNGFLAAVQDRDPNGAMAFAVRWAHSLSEGNDIPQNAAQIFSTNLQTMLEFVRKAFGGEYRYVKPST